MALALRSKLWIAAAAALLLGSLWVYSLYRVYDGGVRDGTISTAADASATITDRAAEEYHAAKKQVRRDVRAGRAATLWERTLSGARAINATAD